MKDYTAMNDAERRSAIGTDPKKWAAACGQMLSRGPDFPDDGFGAAEWFRGMMTVWFRDAMQAARDAKDVGEPP